MADQTENHEGLTTEQKVARIFQAERWTLTHANDMGATELAEGRARIVLFGEQRD